MQHELKIKQQDGVWRLTDAKRYVVSFTDRDEAYRATLRIAARIGSEGKTFTIQCEP